MRQIIITGASRGIGRALAAQLGRRDDTHLTLVARDAAKLQAVAAMCRNARPIAADLALLSSARDLGRQLAGSIQSDAILVHNAGIWPAQRELTADGYERAYALNCAAPLELQLPLLAAGKLARVMVISAGLIGAGRFDPTRTPAGEDFSAFRTYASTKRHFAEAIRALAPRYPAVDFLVLHPGVVRTNLGARGGPLGWMLEIAKRRWEEPEVCAARLERILEIPRWSKPGEASWYFEEKPSPWPI